MASTVLEIGGGSGDFQVELLRAGATESVNVELLTYMGRVTELMKAEGLTGRMPCVLGDFVEKQSSIAEPDAVVLDRVICCHPYRCSSDDDPVVAFSSFRYY